MGFTKNFLELLQGKVHFYLYVGGKPAVEIVLHNKEIIADIKNPILAIELGMKQFGKGGGKLNSYVLKTLKAAGFKIKVKYKFFELEL